MRRRLKKAFCAVGILLFFLIGFSFDLHAFSITETKKFREGPYAVHLEIQVKGPGQVRKTPFQVSSLKVKIKNERLSSQVLKVRAIRAFQDPAVFTDIETRGYSVSPGQWVTKHFRLPKGKKPFLGQEGFIQIVFENFNIQFNPLGRKFQGPSS